MIYETRVNLKNKRKNELIMYLEEALKTIQKQDTEINKLKEKVKTEYKKGYADGYTKCEDDHGI